MNGAVDGEQQPLARISEARSQLEGEIARVRRDRDLLRRETDRQGATGDRADEAEALEESDEVARLTARITALTEQRDHLDRMIVGRDHENEELADGTRVTVRYADGTVETMDAVAVTEEAGETDEGILTLDSPLGRALSGTRAGDVVEYSAPTGPTRVQVLAIRPPNTG